MNEQKLLEKLKTGVFLERGDHTKFEITESDDHFIFMTQLNDDGTRTQIIKKMLKTSMVGLLRNNYFDFTPFPARETYYDLKKYDVGRFFIK